MNDPKIVCGIFPKCKGYWALWAGRPWVKRRAGSQKHSVRPVIDPETFG